MSWDEYVEDLGPDDDDVRVRENRRRLDSGDIIKVSEVARQLLLRQRFSTVARGEAEMLAEARQLLIEALSAPAD